MPAARLLRFAPLWSLTFSSGFTEQIAGEEPWKDAVAREYERFLQRILSDTGHYVQKLPLPLGNPGGIG